MTSVLIRPCEDTDTQGKCHVMPEALTAVRQLKARQDKDGQLPPGAARSKERCFPRASRGSPALLTADFRLLASRTGRQSVLRMF